MTQGADVTTKFQIAPCGKKSQRIDPIFSIPFVFLHQQTYELNLTVNHVVTICVVRTLTF